MNDDAYEQSQAELQDYFSEGASWPPEGELEELIPTPPPPDTETLVSLTLGDIAKVMRGITDEAERYYYLWRVVADLDAKKKELGNEIKENGLDDFSCASGKACLVVSTSKSSSLDRKALEKAIGKRTIARFVTQSETTTLRVKYLGEEASE